MPTRRASRIVLTGLLAALTVAATAGCGSRSAVAQAPAGVKVGPALTQAQVQAIQKKRAAQMGN